MEDDDNFGEKNGFFKTYHISVLRKLRKGDLAGFSVCRNDEERLVYVHGLPYVHEIPQEMSTAMAESIPNGKSAIEAQKKRTEGNEFFKKKDYQCAVRLYTEAISKAPSIPKGRKPIDVRLWSVSELIKYILIFSIYTKNGAVGFQWTISINLTITWRTLQS